MGRSKQKKIAREKAWVRYRTHHPPPINNLYRLTWNTAFNMGWHAHVKHIKELN